jgi:hypothetical protein
VLLWIRHLRVLTAAWCRRGAVGWPWFTRSQYHYVAVASRPTQPLDRPDCTPGNLPGGDHRVPGQRQAAWRKARGPRLGLGANQSDSPRLDASV